MKHRNQPERQRRQIARLHQLIEQGRFLRATLLERERLCGKSNCRCTRGHKHRSLYIGQSKDGKNRSAYVPPAWEERVRSWVEGRREVDALLEELSDFCWDQMRQRKE